MAGLGPNDGRLLAASTVSNLGDGVGLAAGGVLLVLAVATWPVVAPARGSRR